MEYVIDAKGKTLGRLASHIAYILQGKNRADFQNNKVFENKLVIKNIKGMKVTGKKYVQKTYYHHTGYMGHLKSKNYREAFEKDAGWVLKHAVSGMLPRNSLKAKRLKQIVFEK